MSDKQDLHDERISRLYQLGSNNEPPEYLDQKIIQEAHEATGKRKSRSVWPSMATAAVLVLSISLVLKVLEQEPLEQSVMEPTSQEMNGNVPATQKDSKIQELEEAVAPRDEQDADNLEGKTRGINVQKPGEDSIKSELSPPAPASAPVLEDATSIKKAMPKGKDAPAVEMYRSQPATPAKATIGKSEVIRATETETQPASTDKLDADSKLLLERRRFKLKATPEKRRQASTLMDQMDLCSQITVPDTDAISEWLDLYREAMLEGNQNATECLKREFQKRFDRPLPIQDSK